MFFPPFRLKVIPRILHFKQPAGTSRGVYRTRQVWYVLLTSAHGPLRFTGLGECAPLHDLSCDFPSDDAAYEAKLREVCRGVEQQQRLDAEPLRQFPSMLMGLETAFASAEASLKGDYRKPFCNTPPTNGIVINGLVWMGRFEEMMQRMEEKLKRGFACVKLKIGAIDFDSELALIRALRSRFSPTEVELRVDANGAFSPAEVPARLEALSRYALHSIEQPIRQGQWHAMAALCRNTPLPIALDEELIGINCPEEKARLLDVVAPQYIILKPTLHGGFSGSKEWMALAKERGIPFWVTSALESNVGLNAIARFTADMGNAYPALRTLPQGLGTGQLFVRNYDAICLPLEADRLCFADEKQRAFEEELNAFCREWHSEAPTLTVHTSGSTGAPKALVVEKRRMEASAKATCQALGLQHDDTALLAMPLKYIAGKMVVVRALVHGLHLIPVAPSLHPFATLHEAPTFAALTPMQVFESLKVPHERRLLRATKHLIIGGGAISEELATALQTFPHCVWSTYGMTETLSHIALRRLNGANASRWYTPLPGVAVSITPEGCLSIEAPAVCPERLTTHDLAVVSPDGRFRIIGRTDNVVCSGGIKLHIEPLEERLRSALPCPFCLTAVKDASLGQRLVMLYEDHTQQWTLEQLISCCRSVLEKHEVPRAFIAVAHLPLTATGKPARAEAAKMAKDAIAATSNKTTTDHQ